MYDQRHDLPTGVQTSQQQSRLLLHLPTEVRLLIWTYALGNQKIHIINKCRRLGYVALPYLASRSCTECVIKLQARDM
jgi:hypothetical protein